MWQPWKRWTKAMETSESPVSADDRDRWIDAATADGAAWDEEPGVDDASTE